MHPLIKCLVQPKNFTLLRVGSAVLCALLILFSLLRAEPINPDGLLYIQAAQAYLTSGLKTSMSVFPWPFVTLTIAYTHQLTHLSLANSAYLLNIILAMFFVGGFITLLRLISNNPLHYLSAAVLIILYPQLNRDAGQITRDIGYWAFSIWALIQLISYAIHPSWRRAILFGCLQLLATAYRSEGVVIFALLPFGLFFSQQTPHRFFNFLRSQSVFIVLAVIAFFWLKTHGDSSDLLHHVSRLTDPILNFVDGTKATWLQKVNSISTHILEPNAKDSGALILLGGTVFVLLNALIKATNGFYLLISFYGMWVHLRQPQRLTGNAILTTFFILNFLIATGFVAEHQFLPARYVAPFCLLFLIFASIGLTQILIMQRGLLKALTIFGFILILLGDTIHTGPSKHYLIAAGDWLKQVPTNEKIFSNNAQIIYYADRSFDYKNNTFTNEILLKLIKEQKINEYTYIAIRLSRHEALPAYFTKLTPNIKFVNSRGDGVWIFHLQPKIEDIQTTLMRTKPRKFFA